MSRVTSATDLLCTTHQTHDNWVASSRVWSHRSLHRFYGRTQTCRNRSDLYVKFKKKAVARHAYIRDQNPSLGYISQVNFISAGPKIWGSVSGGDRVAWARCPRCSVEAGQKCVQKLKEKNKATFFLLSENGCLPSSTLKPDEREFVVHSGASMHMVSKKDLNDAEMDIVTKSCSPAVVITANGEVQTHEEATVHVKELDIFLTVKVLENTPAVLSLGKLCDENGYS